MQPLAGTIPPIAVDVSSASLGPRARDMRTRLPAAARRVTSFAYPPGGRVVARSCFAVRNVARLLVPALLSAALLSPAQPALADFTQNGPKLVGGGAVGAAQQGFSVALSADGHTAIVGGNNDNGGAGAAWVFIRSGGVWTQQGNKLVGTGAVGAASQGWSVALSADGNTAIVGGNNDNGGAGAAWVFTRSGGVWTPQGNKLVGTDAVGAAQQGFSVALSADGNTAIVGGNNDNSNAGAAWVFTRSGGVWSQQGNKLVGTVAVGAAQQGASVALSDDGDTAIVGGNLDNSNAGAAWVFTRSGGVWSQQGAKLVGTGAVNPAFQGISVALSADGNTAIVGGNRDNGNVGAAWVFTRSGGVWSQQGNKLVGASIGGATAQQGFSVALSGGGNTALVGGWADNSNADAAWVFTRSGGVWTQQGGKLVGTAAVNPALQGISVALSCNTAIVGGPADNTNAGAVWVFLAPPTGTHDFNCDAKSDILWRNTSGQLALWFMNGAAIASATDAGTVTTDWSVVGQRDFNSDGFADILWRNTSGLVAIWLMNGATVLAAASPGTVTTDWAVAGTGDFDGDGRGDILWRNTTNGQVAIWLMNGTTIASAAGLGATLSGGGSAGFVATAWTIVATGDFNSDGKSDLLWRDSSGNTAIWLMDGTTVLPSSASLGNAATSWTIQGSNAD
jgi:hypothetical protein